MPAVKLKSVAEVLDDRPVIGQEMLALMRFMCERYHLRVVDALRLFIPAQMRGGRIKELKKRFVRVADEYVAKDENTFIRAGAAAQREVFAFVKNNGEADTAYLGREFSAAAVRNLIDRGVLAYSKRRNGARRMPPPKARPPR